MRRNRGGSELVSSTTFRRTASNIPVAPRGVRNSAFDASGGDQITSTGICVNGPKIPSRRVSSPWPCIWAVASRSALWKR